MRVHAVGTWAIATNPTATAEWLVKNFGFRINVDLGWYVNTQHPDHPSLHFDVVRQGHESAPANTRERLGGGLGLLVDDVDAEATRLEEAGVEFLLRPVTEPWGQRRCQVVGPDNICVEVLQQVPPDPEWMAEQGLTQS